MKMISRKNLATVSVIAWSIGLLSFLLPFASTMGLYISRVDKVSVSGISLMTKLFAADEMAEMLLEYMPVNGYLWIAFFAGVLGVIMAISCGFYWEQARDERKPIVSIVCALVGTACIFLAPSIYSGESLSNGFGWNLAFWSYLIAALSMIGAYQADKGAVAKETPEPQEPQREPKTLKDRFLDGEITAEEYEKTREREKIASSKQSQLEALKKHFLDGEIAAEEYEREKKRIQTQVAGTVAKTGRLSEDGGKACFDGSRANARRVVCPACGTAQSAQRKQCYECHMEFVFDEEQ